jgi:hypothetical protein
MVAKCGATLALMLATRRLSLQRLMSSSEELTNGAEHMKRLVDILQGAKK